MIRIVLPGARQPISSRTARWTRTRSSGAGAWVAPLASGRIAGNAVASSSICSGGSVLKAVGRSRLEVAVQRVDEEPERELALELGGPAVEDQAVLVGGAVGELSQQPGLADPGLALDRRESRVAGLCGRRAPREAGPTRVLYRQSVSPLLGPFP